MENRLLGIGRATGIILLSASLASCAQSEAEQGTNRPTILSPTEITLPTYTPEITVFESLTPSPKPTLQPTPEPTPKSVAVRTETELTQKTYTKNLYVADLVRYESPDYNACVAASTEMMLNFISKSADKGAGFIWKPTTSYDIQENILVWERAHDTQTATDAGTDANGWRNGLNEYGWGTYSDPNKMVYKVTASASYDAAVKAAVMAIARYNKPVGILALAGGHATIINGYIVEGADPAVSSDFKVDDIYLTDPYPWETGSLRNVRISYADFENGSLKYRFLAYTYTDNPYDDPYTPGVSPAYIDWYNKWVMVVPTS